MGVSIFNTGYDLQDQIDAAESAIAIVSIGDAHVAITSGQYVYVREHGTLAEGLYRATANIAANGTLSGSNVTAVSGGGLNALNSNIANMARIKKDNIAAGATKNIDISGTPCFVSVGRGSVSTQTTTAFIDGWSGIVYISSNSNFTITVNSTTSISITNNSGSYANYIVVY